MVPPYQIPYRSLVVAGLANCFVAGRCFSADRPALASARIMATSCLAGQAVAHAAALALRHRSAVRDVDTAALRDRLLADSRDPEPMRARLVPPRRDRPLLARTSLLLRTSVGQMRRGEGTRLPVGRGVLAPAVIPILPTDLPQE